MSEAERTWERGEGVQWPNDRNPILFMVTATPLTTPVSGAADGPVSGQVAVRSLGGGSERDGI
ncbi:hypothetical protein GCM10007147_06030 [Nocardiopsis kunsanensis]|uniref:Uncharacterized protein n=1 Tax=Nocardiopsis kunsanensis TaxID=141693 RepID=A0A918X7N9_9ACTN|nr:hypothetical protein GCM10007147_06030 [Nocardiopsis kunsanensis]